MTNDAFVYYILPVANGERYLVNSKIFYAWIRVDTNGIKEPNTLGKDIFSFYLTDSGIIPCGTNSDDMSYFPNDCVSKGYGCTAWVIQQKNMKYLHSNKCSWQNTNCK